MGTRYIYKCNRCKYKLESSGKTSRGMFYVVSPYLCLDCRIISDVAVGMLGDIYSKEWFDSAKKNILPSYMLENKDEFFRCEDCEGKNIEAWDSSIGECPKCNGKLSVDKDAPVTCWD